jgi:hypothetical protein
MRKRNLRVLKWLGILPAIAVCTRCNREFRVPLDALKRVADAQANLKSQFAAHECKQDEADSPAG